VRSAFLSILLATFTVAATAQLDAPIIPKEPLVTLTRSRISPEIGLTTLSGRFVLPLSW